MCKVFPSAEGIEKAALRMPCHCIDREVAAGKVLPDIVYEGHGVRVPHVGISALRTVGRALYRLAADDSGHGAMLRSRLMHLDAGAAQDPLRLLPMGRCGDVDIVGSVSPEGIPHPAADDPCFISCILKSRKHPFGILRQKLRGDC